MVDQNSVLGNPFKWRDRGTGRYNRPQAGAMLTALILGAFLLLQSAAPAAPAEITLDFIATGQDGHAVTNLALADIILKVGGKQRPVRSLELVIPAETGRTILLLTDEATLYTMEPVAKEAIAKLVASLKPKDRIGYFSTARSGRLSPPSTGARAGGEGGRCDGDRSGRPADLSVGYAANHRGSTWREASREDARAPWWCCLAASTTTPTFGTGEAAGCPGRSEAMRPVAETISAAQINV